MSWRFVTAIRDQNLFIGLCSTEIELIPWLPCMGFAPSHCKSIFQWIKSNKSCCDIYLLKMSPLCTSNILSKKNTRNESRDDDSKSIDSEKSVVLLGTLIISVDFRQTTYFFYQIHFKIHYQLDTHYNPSFCAFCATRVWKDAQLS